MLLLERIQDTADLSPEGRYLTWWDRDVRAWIAADWPFQTVAYPEREYSFDEWSAIVDQR